MEFTADFETTTDENDCRVWAWAVCEIGNSDNFIYGNTIESFISFLEKSKNSTFYFHNLKFDMEWILVWLFENGFTHVKTRKEEHDKSFSTIIANTGQVYAIRIVFKKKNKKIKYVTLYDSLKILPFSVSQIASAFNLPISKLTIDYKKYREKGYNLSPIEVDYIKNDVKIVALALDILFKQGLTKITQGSNALHDFKQTIGLKNFEMWFPIPDYDYDVRQAYKGGFTYLNDTYKEKEITEGIVLDVNSLYPYVLRNCKLPFGNGIFFDGKYENDTLYPLYVQQFSCTFELKENKIPTIQMKHDLRFIPTDYLKDSGGKEVTLCLTNIDLELFLEHYEVYNPTWLNGWKFMASDTIFKPYIDKWIKIKNESTRNGNKAMRTLAKLMLNALYGKFGLNPKIISKIPYYDNGVIKFRKGEEERRKPLYIPVAVFTTAYARNITIRSAQKVYSIFRYADTDSLHLEIKLPEKIKQMKKKDREMLTTKDLQEMGIELPNDFNIDGVELGAWKVESIFYRAKYLRQKCYIEDENTNDKWNKEKYSKKEIVKYCEENNINEEIELEKYKDKYNKDDLKITVSGMPDNCYQYVTWENFEIGATYKGKLQPKHVVGGIVLADTDFTIRP